MKFEEMAAVLLKDWFNLEQHVLEACLCLLSGTKNGEVWLEQNPRLYLDPMAGVDPRSFGVHQRPDCNLMPNRECVLGRRTVWIFDHHIESLLHML